MNIFSQTPIALPLGRREKARLAILAALRRSGPVPRAALGRSTGLSPASVSAIVGALIAEGTLVEEGAGGAEAVNGPGRPGIVLDFSPQIGVMIGLWVGLDRIVLQLLDFAGRPIAERREILPLHHLAARDIVARLAERVADFRGSEAAGMNVLSLGISFQGFVDTHAGLVIWSPVMAERAVPIRDEMARLTQLPVELDNDASAMAYAIMRREPGLQSGITACLMLGDGVGLALLVDGQGLRGTRGGGNEFGHMRLDPHGPQCRCGARGCIESYLADYAILRDALAVCDVPQPANMRQPLEAEMLHLVRLAEGGEATLQELFTRAGTMLARGVTSLIHLFQPANIVVCGPGVRAWHLLEAGFHAELERGAIAQLRRLTSFSVVEFTPALLTEGVVLRALDHVDRRLAAGI